MPPKQARAAQFVVAHAFEATTSPMRSLAKSAGETPATFTRLAQAMGFTGWDELRAELTAETRADIVRAQSGPFSSRGAGINSAGLFGDMVRADAETLFALSSNQLADAAAILETAPRVFIAGFRSCYAPAALLHYLYRLFRPDVALIGGPGGILDLELGSLRPDDAVVIFGFQPYSRDSLLAAKAASDAGCRTVVIVDDAAAPIAADGNAILTFGIESPSFFPSLTGCVSLVQGLAALLYARSGEAGRRVLRRSESRIEAHTAYLTDSGGSN